jgi:hypothetical protein
MIRELHVVSECVFSFKVLELQQVEKNLSAKATSSRGKL